MNQHGLDTNGFTADLYAHDSDQWLLDVSIVLSETIEYAKAVIQNISPSQKASLKKAITYLSAMRERQSEAYEARQKTFEDEQNRLKAYIKKRQNGER